MKPIIVGQQDVNIEAQDGLRMTFRAQGGNIKVKPALKAGLTQKKMIGTSLHEDFDRDVSVHGFSPACESIMCAADTIQKDAKPIMEVTVDQPNGYYMVAVVSDEDGGNPVWQLPREGVTVENHAKASPFSRNNDFTLNKKLKEAIRVTFDIPVNYPKVKKNQKGFGNFFGRIIRFLKVKVIAKIKKVIKDLNNKLAKFVDSKLLKKAGLKIIRTNMSLSPLSLANRKRMEGKHVLLFVHGIFSSTTGAFSDLSDEMRGDSVSPLHKLVTKYDGRVLGFDHYTVSKSTLQNAKDLVDALPKGCQLNIVCHSRGAGVVRCLTEHDAVVSKMDTKGITVNNIVFCAGACLGSPLAQSGAVDRLVNRASVLGGLTGNPVTAIPTGAVAYLFKLLLHGVQKWPGVEAMDPDADIFENIGDSTMEKKYIYYRANFDPDNILLDIADQAVFDDVVFQGAGNDVIVPFIGAGKDSKYLEDDEVERIEGANYGTERKPKNDVWHITFFSQPEVRAGILKHT